MQSLLIAVVGAVVLAGPLGFWLGDGMATGRYEARIASIATGITESQNAAIEDANQRIEAAAKRAAAAEKQRARQRNLAAEVNREIAQDTDRSCEWRDAHRLRIETLYRTFGYPVEVSTDRMHGAVLAPAESIPPP